MNTGRESEQRSTCQLFMMPKPQTASFLSLKQRLQRSREPRSSRPEERERERERSTDSTKAQNATGAVRHERGFAQKVASDRRCCLLRLTSAGILNLRQTHVADSQQRKTCTHA